MFYTKVLVISDNVAQCVRVKKLLQQKQIITSIELNWACSVYSNKELFEIQLQQTINQIDLKNNDTVGAICSNYNLVISLHCKQLFPAALVNTVKCINVHPGYNPENRGWYPQVFSIINDTVVGATIHEIDEQLDHGKIIDRMLVNINSWDNSLDIYNRVLDAEMQLLDKNIMAILNNNYQSLEPENEGKLYLKKDFNNLCKLNLSEVGTLKQHINLLRALTHGDYKNAYYIDEKTNKKIYVSISFNIQN
jgi:methionyl-tRNA formyltransferase